MKTTIVSALIIILTTGCVSVKKPQPKKVSENKITPSFRYISNQSLLDCPVSSLDELHRKLYFESR